MSSVRSVAENASRDDHDGDGLPPFFTQPEMCMTARSWGSESSSIGPVPPALASAARRVGRPPVVLDGSRWGRLTVLGDTGERSSEGVRKLRCVCDCGNSTVVRADHLKSGHTQSCGCLLREIMCARRALSDSRGEHLTARSCGSSSSVIGPVPPGASSQAVNA